MAPEYSWSGKFTAAERAEAAASPDAAPIPEKQKTAKTEQELCDELFALGDMLSVHIFSMDGEILGTNFGEIPVDDELKVTFGDIAANVWSGVKKAEGIGGSVLLATITYENFKIIGIPFEKSGVGVLAVVEDKVDAMYVKDRVIEFVKYWISINKLRKRVGQDKK